MNNTKNLWIKIGALYLAEVMGFRAFTVCQMIGDQYSDMDFATLVAGILWFFIYFVGFIIAIFQMLDKGQNK